MTTAPDDFVSATLIKTKSDITGNDIQYYNGLTKREYFAVKAMTGWASRGADPQYAARIAVETADALIEELNKPLPDGN